MSEDDAFVLDYQKHTRWRGPLTTPEPPQE
jgi:hypothetical protein